MPKAPPIPTETKKVTIADGVRLYTGIGHAPFMGGRTIRLPAHHAAALEETGHVTDATVTAGAPAPEEAAPSPAEPAAAAETAHPGTLGPASAVPAPGPVLGLSTGPGAAPTAAR
jgi:hypothetical protein